MIKMAFAAEDLVHTRFAISPLWEAVASGRRIPAQILVRGA